LARETARKTKEEIKKRQVGAAFTKGFLFIVNQTKLSVYAESLILQSLYTHFLPVMSLF